ncbi:lysyl-tRNA synthetase [Angomonas deanei]|nr:lysyl-tRNA synthetase [Angomonas deanei]|eukprot:EPY40679.1 lysyl-tRNA synthetase [Angomonas deanei]
MVNEMGLMGAAYPHKFKREYTLPDFKAKFAPQVKAPGDRASEKTSIAGRVINKRSSGSKLHFITLQGDMDTLQVISMLDDYSNPQDFATIHGRVKRGDIIGVEGYASLSKTNEFSMSATSITLLSTCFHMLPDDYYGLSSFEQRFRQRYLDFIVNRSNINTFVQRAKIIKYIRDFFSKKDFVEVETPTLNQIAGGAAARPFITYHNDLNQTMYLRIAPELYLKELVVGGMDRVFEIGKQFRNEGIDLTHNPEFTSCEAYWAYQDYEDWMNATEELLHGMAVELHGSPIVKYAPKDSEGKPLPEVTFNFSRPFKRLHIIPELEKRIGISFSSVDFESEAAIEFLLKICKEKKVDHKAPFTVPRLLDDLIAHYLEPECHDPCFICDHPRVMSPLAKWHRNDPRLSERFELFVNKKELANAYTELNNPIIQREEFVKQMKNRDKGDDESMEIDEGFVQALEHALPPTGGWGLGIDRLVMFMTSQANIKEVLLFPAMKPEGRGGFDFPPGTLLNGQGVPLL